MTIRHIGILAIALVALSACKAVTLEEATVTQPTFGIEAEDWGVPASNELRQDDYHALTPTTHPTAAVINTQDLHAQLIGSNPPVTINVLDGRAHRSIPGSIWLPKSGYGGSFDDDIQAQLASTLGTITEGDLARPIVVFCLDASCWLSYNAALRLHALGYETLYWYRGGINAWNAANLPARMTTVYRQ